MECVVCKKELSGMEWFSFESDKESGKICQQCYSIVLTLQQQIITEEDNQSFIRLQHFLKEVV